MTSFSDSEFYCESNGTLVIKLLPVRDREAAQKGRGPQFSMTSFSDSEFYCESNGGSLVIRRFPVPEIERPRKRGVAPNFR